MEDRTRDLRSKQRVALGDAGTVFQGRGFTAECCDFSESATTVIEESIITVQLRLHQQILRKNTTMEN